ncbi:hypothetical protein PVAP13_6NG180703 [Panicum virgatum]|uniref:Uncharacterized protein n=1 Tax=Panicum virgatum TaxID=38727 RepID=A0A8T0QXQ8_PANVG|nr:hypothetical protein PVAP13_6NG180703 [Panicum virgatum]
MCRPLERINLMIQVQLSESRRGSFFNWFYFSIDIGALISSSFLVWVQDNVGWGLGFGIPTVFMGLAIIS